MLVSHRHGSFPSALEAAGGTWISSGGWEARARVSA